MDRHPRKPAQLDIGTELARSLAAARVREGVAEPAQLDIDRVRDIEAGVGCRIPDGVLAVIAAALPSLRSELGVDLGAVLAHTAKAREAGARGDLVVFGSTPGDGFVAFAGGTASDDVLALDRKGRVRSTSTVEQWVRDRIGEDAPDTAEPTTFALVREVEAPGAPTAARQARHAKWGIGTVLAEHGEGPTRKVKVDFPGIGLKTVQARFLDLGE